MKMITALGENTVPICTEIAGQLSQKVGIEIEFEPVPSSTPEAEPLFNGAVELGWICGLLYVEKKDHEQVPLDLLAAPIFAGSDRPDYFSHLIVPADSDASSLEDLSGKSWAINEYGSWSGNHLMRSVLHEKGLTVDYFREIIVSGAHSKSVKMVADGLADFATIDHGVFDFVSDHEPGLLQQIKVIGQIGPSPAPPFVVHRSVPAEIKREIRATLLALGKEPSFKKRVKPHRLASLVPVVDKDYDPIRIGYQNSLSLELGS